MEDDLLNSWIVSCLASHEETLYTANSVLLASAFVFVNVALKVCTVCSLTHQFHAITCWLC